MVYVKTFLKKYWLYALGGILGAIAGYVYWINWACDTGCPLTETPTRTVLYGALLGGLLLNIFTNNKNKEK